jgi:hypothetical protein
MKGSLRVSMRHVVVTLIVVVGAVPPSAAADTASINGLSVPTVGSQPNVVVEVPNSALWGAELAGNESGRLDVDAIEVDTDAHAAIPTGAAQVARSFVVAVNSGDWWTACAMYSHDYLRVGQSACVALYRWGWRLYGPYRYRVVGRRMVGPRYRVDLTRRGATDFVDFAHEGDDWKVVAGGW